MDIFLRARSVPSKSIIHFEGEVGQVFPWRRAFAQERARLVTAGKGFEGGMTVRPPSYGEVLKVYSPVPGTDDGFDAVKGSPDVQIPDGEQRAFAVIQLLPTELQSKLWFAVAGDNGQSGKGLVDI